MSVEKSNHASSQAIPAPPRLVLGYGMGVGFGFGVGDRCLGMS